MFQLWRAADKLTAIGQLYAALTLIDRGTLSAGTRGSIVFMASKASAAQCGSTAAGFESWKRQFAIEAQGRGVSRL